MSVKIKTLLTVVLLLSLMVSTSAWASESSVTSASLTNFFWRVIVFTAFASILYFLLRKPIGNALKGRQEDIAHNIKFLETQAKNLEEQTQEMVKKMTAISSEREKLIEQFKEEGQIEKEKIIAEAKESVERIKKQAEATLAQEINLARAQLKSQIIASAAVLAEEKLKKNITESDQKNLTKEFMEQITLLEADKN